MKTKLLLIGLVLCHTVLSQKIFPGAEGFGTNSRAAYETGNTPTILIVNTLSSGNFSTGINSGTFLWCLEQDYPRIIVFSVGGVIDYSGTVMTIRVRNPYLTIYGQTAPSPGIIIKGANIDLVTQHVLIQHVKFRIGDDIRDQVPDARDCLGFYDPGDNIVIDHCSFEWSIDELIGISSKTAGHYTISNSILAEPLRRSIHYGDKMQPEKHNLYMLTSSNGNGSSLTMKNNLLAFGEGRSPAVTLSNAIIINDLVYGGKGVADIRNADGNQSLICAIGNKMIPLLIYSFSNIV